MCRPSIDNWGGFDLTTAKAKATWAGAGQSERSWSNAGLKQDVISSIHVGALRADRLGQIDERSKPGDPNASIESRTDNTRENHMFIATHFRDGLTRGEELKEEATHLDAHFQSVYIS